MFRGDLLRVIAGGRPATGPPRVSKCKFRARHRQIDFRLVPVMLTSGWLQQRQRLLRTAAPLRPAWQTHLAWQMYLCCMGQHDVHSDGDSDFTR